MKVKDWTFDDLIDDNSFKDWVLSNRVENNEIWEKELKKSPTLINEAANFIQDFQFDKKSLPIADIDAAWSMLEDTISKPKTIAISRRLWLRTAAAAVLILATATTFWFTSTKKIKTIAQTTTFGEQSVVNLPDASIAQLSANTELTFNNKWNISKKREVNLKGQAFFDVEATADKATFTVNTKHFKIEVLGTQFDVMARESGSSIAVKEGKVRVTLSANSEVVVDDKIIKKATVDLLAGDKLTFKGNQYGNQYIVSKVDVNEINAHRVLLENAILADFKNIFKDIYGYELEFTSEAIANKPFSGNLFFTDNDLKTSLMLLEEGFGLKYKITGKRIIISK
jgi:transmembrane sensor